MRVHDARVVSNHVQGLESDKGSNFSDRPSRKYVGDAGCHCKSTNNVGSYTQIGNAELIEKRVARPVECAPGGTLADAAPFDQIRFEDSERDKVAAYLTTPEARPYRNALEKTSKLIDGFESPLGMELLATVDMILHREGVEPSVEAVKARLPNWPGGKTAGQRKVKLFEDRIIAIALEALCESDLSIARA